MAGNIDVLYKINTNIITWLASQTPRIREIFLSEAASLQGATNADIVVPSEMKTVGLFTAHRSRIVFGEVITHTDSDAAVAKVNAYMDFLTGYFPTPDPEVLWVSILEGVPLHKRRVVNSETGVVTIEPIRDAQSDPLSNPYPSNQYNAFLRNGLSNDSQVNLINGDRALGCLWF